MRKIGSFVRDGEGFKGSIVTLSLQALDVRIEPQGKNGDRLHVVLIGGATLGEGQFGLARAGAVLELELDDPSFAGPIIATLVPRSESDCFDLIWRRDKPASA